MFNTVDTEHASDGTRCRLHSSLKNYRVLNLLPERGSAGAQNVAIEITALLNNENWPSHLAYLDDLGIGFNDSGELSLRNIFWKCRALLRSYLWLRAEKSSGNWDAVISHIDRADWLNAFTTSTKAKSIIYCHGSKRADLNYCGLFGRLRQRLTYTSYSKVDHIVCVSNGLRSELLTDDVVVDRNTSVILNWLDIGNTIERASVSLPQKYLTLAVTKRPVFLSVGRLTAQKQPDALLKAFKQARFFDVRPILLFVGDGEMYEELLQLAYSLEFNVCEKVGALEIDDVDVVFTGYQSNPMAFITHSTSLVSTSIWEGLPLVMIEALVLGKHIIANDCPHGPSELVDLANTLVTSGSQVRAQCLSLMSGLTDVNQFATALERRVQQYDDWNIDVAAARDIFSRRTALSEIQEIIRYVIEDK